MRTSKRKPNKQYQSAPTDQTPKPPPTPEQIQQRAHEIYLARGDAPGTELSDWLQAERELREQSRPAAGAASLKPTGDH